MKKIIIPNTILECSKFIFATGSLLNILSKKKHLNLRDSAADNDIKFFALNNTRSLSTSVFPTGSGSNPNITLFMLALRCMDQISNNK